MLPDRVAFVDIETTGLRAFYDRIIEIGILRVEKNKITQTFHSLVDPQTHIPKEITMLTGIKSQDLEDAPTFREINDKILEAIEGCVIAAHNVRFDYGFLKNEFRRINYDFKKKHFCTVKLSRALFPEYKHHNLDSLIERFGFRIESRHRALDDAKILFSFYEKILKDFPAEKIAAAINIGIKKPSIPLNLKTDPKSIPEKPGVYIFYGQTLPLYIGKSVNLRERVLSHFSSDLNSPLEMKIAQQIESIEYVETAGELGALLLESELIKSMLPLYNKKSRIKRELVVLKSKKNKHGYEEVFAEPVTKISLEDIAYVLSKDTDEKILGFFKSKKQAKSLLAEMAKEHRLCEKLLGLEKDSRAKKTSCFGYRLELCKGACVAKEKPVSYNMRFAAAFASSMIKSWPFEGPMVITETNGDKKDSFVINKWCYLGKVKLDNEGNVNYTQNASPVFELDVYSILRQFLSKPQNYKKIHPISKKELSDAFRLF